MNWNILAGNKAINGDDIINQLFPNIPMLIAHIFATIILLLVLWRWVYKPFRTLLHNRHLNIKSKLDDAGVKQALANQDRSHALEMLNSAKVEATVIVNDAKTKAYDERKEILDQAHVEAMRITNQSKHDIAKQRKAVEKEIKAEIETVSLELAKVILNSEIDAKKHQKFIDDFIDKV